MAPAPLVDTQINLGERLLAALKEAHFDVSAALWWFSPEAERWVLMIASKDVERDGPAASYRRLHAALQKTRGAGIYLNEPTVSVIDPKHPLLTTLRDYFDFRQEPKTKGAPLDQHTINGYAIEGAYVYWL